MESQSYCKSADFGKSSIKVIVGWQLGIPKIILILYVSYIFSNIIYQEL